MANLQLLMYFLHSWDQQLFHMNAQTKAGWTIIIATGATPDFWLDARGVEKTGIQLGKKAGARWYCTSWRPGRGKSMETCERLGEDSKRAPKVKTDKLDCVKGLPKESLGVGRRYANI